MSFVCRDDAADDDEDEPNLDVPPPTLMLCLPAEFAVLGERVARPPPARLPVSW